MVFRIKKRETRAFNNFTIGSSIKVEYVCHWSLIPVPPPCGHVVYSVVATTKQNSEDEDPPLKVKQQIVSLSSREVLFSNTMHPVFPSACFYSRVEF